MVLTPVLQKIKAAKAYALCSHKLTDVKSLSFYPQHKALLLFSKVIEVKKLCGKIKAHY